MICFSTRVVRINSEVGTTKNFNHLDTLSDYNICDERLYEALYKIDEIKNIV